MKFNYFNEKKKFLKEWEEEKTAMRVAGLSEEDICQIYDYDWDWFKSRRIFCIHNELYCPEVLEQLSYMDLCDNYLSADLLDSIENPKLYQALLNLKNEDYDLLMRRVIEDRPLKEIADIYGCSVANISNRVTRILKKLKKACE